LAAPEEPDDSQATASISWGQAMAFDADGDGHLYEAEFESLMKHYSPDLSDQEISDLFDDMDSNNSGRVGDNEYTPVW
jgi:Ca2+-binding EF-hand superfamily protein